MLVLWTELTFHNVHPLKGAIICHFHRVGKPSPQSTSRDLPPDTRPGAPALGPPPRPRAHSCVPGPAPRGGATRGPLPSWAGPLALPSGAEGGRAADPRALAPELLRPLWVPALPSAPRAPKLREARGAPPGTLASRGRGRPARTRCKRDQWPRALRGQGPRGHRRGRGRLAVSAEFISSSGVGQE